MKTVQTVSVTLALAAALIASANAAEINRLANPPPSLILAGVLIPAHSELLMLSGQLASSIDPLKPATSIADFGDTKTQTISTFKKIDSALKRAGYTMKDVVKLTVFVAGDPALGGKMDFAGFNEGYKQFFGTAENPNLVARSTVQVAALATQDKVDELQDKLRDAGIKSYTQKVSSPAGERIRVRVGPFGSREDAEKTRAKLQKLGLGGSLVPA